jgi:NADH-quinone oxidoreductase subunit H
MMQDLVVYVVYIGYAVSVLLIFGTVLTWVERKQAAIMADRIGANRAYVRIPFTNIKLVWLGLFHGLADGIKMML